MCLNLKMLFGLFRKHGKKKKTSKCFDEPSKVVDGKIQNMETILNPKFRK